MDLSTPPYHDDHADEHLTFLNQRLDIASRYTQKLEAKYAEVFRENLNHSLNIDLLNEKIGERDALIKQQGELLEMASDRVKQLEEELSTYTDANKQPGEHHGPSPDPHNT